MAETGLYTCDQLKAKLISLDTEMDTAVTRSGLDTGQSKSDFSRSLRQLERQYEKYMGMLQRQCPDEYKAIAGPSVIKFNGRKC